MAKKTPDEKSARQAQEGFALLAAPSGVTGASAGGAQYEVDESGVIEVAAEHVPALLEHGFTPLEG